MTELAIAEIWNRFRSENLVNNDGEQCKFDRMNWMVFPSEDEEDSFSLSLSWEFTTDAWDVGTSKAKIDKWLQRGIHALQQELPGYTFEVIWDGCTGLQCILITIESDA